MSRTQIIFGFLTALLLFIVYQTFLILGPFLKPFFWAGVITFSFFPIYENIKRSLNGKETIASLISTLLIFFIVLPFTIFIIYNLAQEAVMLYRWGRDYIQEGRLQLLLNSAKEWPILRHTDAFIQWDIIEQNIQEWILSAARTLGNFTIKQITIFTKNLLLGIVNFFLTFFLIFFLFKDGPKIYSFFYYIAPMEEDVKNEIFHQITDTFSAVIRGQIVTAIAQSITAGVIFWALGLPLPIFFAALTFLISMVPILGAAAVWVPFVIYLFMIGSTTKAVILFLLGVFVISLLDNFLKPHLIGQKIKLPYLLLFVGILGGLQLYGMIGIFLAPTVLSLLFILIKIFRERFLPDL